MRFDRLRPGGASCRPEHHTDIYRTRWKPDRGYPIPSWLTPDPSVSAQRQLRCWTTALDVYGRQLDNVTQLPRAVQRCLLRRRRLPTRPCPPAVLRNTELVTSDGGTTISGGCAPRQVRRRLAIRHPEPRNQAGHRDSRRGHHRWVTGYWSRRRFRQRDSRQHRSSGGNSDAARLGGSHRIADTTREREHVVFEPRLNVSGRQRRKLR